MGRLKSSVSHFAVISMTNQINEICIAVLMAMNNEGEQRDKRTGHIYNVRAILENWTCLMFQEFANDRRIH